jgi:hypothetical protein
MKTWLNEFLRPVAVLAAALVSSHGAEVGAPVVVQRGPHDALWQRVVEHTTSYGKKYYRTNSYREIATGKHYLKNGEWVASVPELAILPSGFGVATQMQHKVIFAPNINTAGAIDCLMPDDKRLQGHVLGLAYTDKATGQGVMIAEIKDSVGVVVGDNQVVYPDAFDSEGGFRADIRYTVTLAGIEQDIILVESPPSPLLYGIQPDNCRLEVYSEFVEWAQPAKETVVLKREEDQQARQAMVEPDLIEETLVFGAMRMPAGTAFRFGAEENDTFIPMGKTWEQREGRQLLIERADYTSIASELGRLPQAAQLQNPKKTLPLKDAGQQAWASFLPARPPKVHAAVRKLRTKEMAQLNLPRQGLVLDYQLVTTQTNVTFRGDETYYVTATVNLAGTTILEGGAVIKYTNGTVNPVLNIDGPLDCRTSPYRPAIFTAKDDDTIGQPIAGSNGSPGTNSYGVMFDINQNTNVIDLRYVHIRNGHYGIYMAGAELTLSHSQIGPSHAAMVTGASKPRLRNVLIHDCRDAVFGGAPDSGFPQGEQVTFHRVHRLRSTSGSSYLTNCLLISVTNNVSISGSNNETNFSDAGIFQTVAYAQRYLASGSAYRNAGTTNINADLLGSLRQRTTYPPLLLTNDITTDTTLTPQAQRDTDAPDLGYHYSPIDWIVGGLSVTGATLTVSGGATVGIDAANTNWGIRLDSGGQLVSNGDPVNLNCFVRTHAVQEIPSGSGTNYAPLFADTYPAPASPTTLNFRFTQIPQIQQHFAFNPESGHGTLSSIILRDSQLLGGNAYWSWGVSNQFMAWTNLLIEKTICSIYPYTPLTFHVQNATFKAGHLGLDLAAGSVTSIKDCIFDYTTFGQYGSGTLTNNYNGYLTNASRLSPNGANDVVLATNTMNFQTGTLGSYYLPTNSPFVDAGSVTNAGFVGLWHYTTQTNQTKDAGTRLDLGFHYVAVDANGQPIDTDGDGFPDYLEDANGDGDVDSGETNHGDASDGGLKVLITRPRDGSVIP